MEMASFLMAQEFQEALLWYFPMASRGPKFLVISYGGELLCYF